MHPEDKLKTVRFLHDTRNVQKLSLALSQFNEVEELASQDQAFLASIRLKLEVWKAIEDEHGPGSCLALDHPDVQRLKRTAPYVRIIPVEFFENAERFTALSASHLESELQN
ncbi:MAG: hypothetical protein KL863_15880 [Rhizobium sp.]|nr:hypothetical protein [Rhizobium sp.]